MIFNLIFQLNALQDLHPLPKIILEYRQVSEIFFICKYVSNDGGPRDTQNHP